MNLMKLATASAVLMTLAIAACSQTPQQQRATGGAAPRDRQMCRYQDRYSRIFTAPCDERYYRRRGY